jgi:bacteriorhodopsin
MGPELLEDRHVELAASAEHVGSAWLMAVVAVMLLMTVVAPFLSP